jgi:uncharacterized protein
MPLLIGKHLPKIEALCRKHCVKRLELFGSAATEEFDGSSSDVDFLVEFLDYDSPEIADQWFGLQEDLERELQRPVDLTSLRTAKDPSSCN